MENFNWTAFSKKIAIKSTRAKLYDAWSKSEDIEKWFLQSCNNTKSDGQLRESNENFEKGDNYQWTWYLYDGLEKGKIVEANGVDLLRFTFAGDCLVEVKFSEIQDNIIVELSQSNIPTDDKSKKDIRLGCESGWSFFLLNLKSVYEGGIDLRNKDEKLKGMMNS